jgi:hypothetical protein
MAAISRGFIGMLIVCVAAGMLSGSFSRETQAAIAIATVIAHGAIGWWLAPRIGDARGIERAAVAATIALGLSTLIPNLLGAIGVLRADVFFAALSVILVLAAMTRQAGSRPSAHDTNPVREPHGVADTVEFAVLATTVVIFAIFVVRWTFVHATAPLGSFGGDDNSYHASAVAVWNATHDLRMLKYSFGDPSPTFYPIGSELQSWTLLAPFRNSDFLMRWSQLPFFAGCLIAIAALARRLSLSVPSAILAVLLFGAMPRVFPELTLTTGNDCSTAFYAVTALHGMLRLRRDPRSALYPGLALGLLVGTKYVGFLYALPLALFALIVLVAARDDTTRPRATAAFATFAIVAVLTGGYTYLRNAYVTGNPLFPAILSIGGRVILPGWFHETYADRMASAESKIDLREFVLNRPRHHGSHFPFTVVPAAILAPLFAIGRRKRLTEVMLLLMPLVFFAEFLLLMRDHREIRYVIAAVAVAGVGFVWLVELLPKNAASFARVATLLIIAANVWNITGNSMPERREAAMAAVVAALIALVALTRLSGDAWRVLAYLGLVAAMALPFRWGSAMDHYHARKYIALGLPEAPAAAQFDAMTCGRGAKVAYAGTNRPYLFFGSEQQNFVDMVPRKGPADDRFFDWSGNVEWGYADGTPDEWIRNLRQVSTRYIVFMREFAADEPERTWAMQRAAMFKAVIVTKDVEVYEFARGSLAPRTNPSHDHNQ